MGLCCSSGKQVFGLLSTGTYGLKDNHGIQIYCQQPEIHCTILASQLEVISLYFATYNQVPS